MAYMTLYRKWRPKTFDDAVGQQAVITALRNQILYNRVGHAYLFCGTRGTGKTSMAKIFARAVNCLNPRNGNPCNECELCREAESGFNLIEIDAASHTGVENIREIRDEVVYTPAKGKYRIYIIDEVHMLSAGAFNALLKTLEEPPEHVIFILATTEPHKVLPTIVSRCQRYDFKRFTVAEIVGQLKKICETEGFRVTDDALTFIARAADGGMRDALSILEQCVSFYMREEITLGSVLEILGASDSEVYSQITDSMAEQDMPRALAIIGRIFTDGRDCQTFVSGWMQHLRSLLMMKTLGEGGGELLELGGEEAKGLLQQSQKLTLPQLTYYIESLSELENRLRYATEKRVILEVAVIRLCHMLPESGDSGLEARLSVLEQKIASGAVPIAAAPKASAKETKSAREHQAPSRGAQMSSQPLQAADGELFSRWAAIKKRVIRENPGLYILNMMELRAGQTPDSLLLVSPNPIYCDQLKARGGEKLHRIEQVIQEETGMKVTVSTYSDKEEKKGTQPEDLRSLLSGVNGDITWE